MNKTEEGGKSIYADCQHVKRIKPDDRVTEEIAAEIGRSYRIIPSFERGLLDYIYTQHYSLSTNELLQCRWRSYKQHIEERVFAPFQFPSNRDLHFYNGCIRFLPSASIHRTPDYKMKLKSGPGVDLRGQLPIPQELMMRRGKINKQDGGKMTKVKQD